MYVRVQESFTGFVTETDLGSNPGTALIDSVTLGIFLKTEMALKSLYLPQGPEVRIGSD